MCGLYFDAPSLDLPAASSVFTTFAQRLWNGDGVTSFGYRSIARPSVVLKSAVTYSIATVNDRKTGRLDSPINQSGIDTGNTPPSEMAVQLLLYGAGDRSRLNGRMMLPEISTDEFSNGGVAPDSMTKLRNILEYAFAGLRDGLAVPVLRDRVHHVSYPVAALVLTDRFAWIHSRGDRRIPTYITVPGP